MGELENAGGWARSTGPADEETMLSDLLWGTPIQLILPRPPSAWWRGGEAMPMLLFVLLCLLPGASWRGRR